MADGCPAHVLLHNAVVLGLVVEAEGLDDRPNLLKRVDDLFAARVVGGEPRRQLAAVLQVQEHSRHQPRDLVCSRQRRQLRGAGTIKMIKRRNAAFMMEFVHAVASTLLRKELSPYHPNKSRHSEIGTVVLYRLKVALQENSDILRLVRLCRGN